MPFQQDHQLRTEAGEVYGQYVETFVSESGQVRADLFRRGDDLVAHVSFPSGLAPEDVTDPWVAELHRFAREQQVANGHLRLIYS